MELTKSLYLSKIKCGTGMERMSEKGRLHGKLVNTLPAQDDMNELTWLKKRRE